MPDAASILWDSQHDLFKGLLLQSQFKVCLFSPFYFNGTHHLNHCFPPSLCLTFLLFCCYLTYSILFLRCSQLLQFKRMSHAGWLRCLSDIAAFTWYPQHSDINKHHAGFDQACLLEASPVTLNRSSTGVLHELLTLSLVVFILGQQVLLYTQQRLFQRAPIWQNRKKIFCSLPIWPW